MTRAGGRPGEHWSSSLGFVLAAAGSAVGLGNLWGFAYRASQGGGAAFVVLYVAIVLVVCLPVLVAEMGEAFPELRHAKTAIEETLHGEEGRFQETLKDIDAIHEEDWSPDRFELELSDVPARLPAFQTPSLPIPPGCVRLQAHGSG